MNGFETFEETKLPENDDFYSLLRNDCVSHKDYEYAKKVWSEFEMKRVGDYLHLHKSR